MLTIKARTLTLAALAALLGLLALAACGGAPAAPAAEVAPVVEVAPAAVAGDAARGEGLFVSSGCAGCHATTGQQIVGPGLAGVFAGKGPYGDKLPNGKPIDEITMAEWIKIGGVGKIGQMPGNSTLTAQELADLAAYLKTLE